MANTYSISLRGSDESPQEQTALQKNVLTQRYKKAEQIRDVLL